MFDMIQLLCVLVMILVFQITSFILVLRLLITCLVYFKHKMVGAIQLEEISSTISKVKKVLFIVANIFTFVLALVITAYSLYIAGSSGYTLLVLGISTPPLLGVYLLYLKRKANGEKKSIIGETIAIVPSLLLSLFLAGPIVAFLIKFYLVEAEGATGEICFFFFVPVLLLLTTCLLYFSSKIQNNLWKNIMVSIVLVALSISSFIINILAFLLNAALN